MRNYEGFARKRQIARASLFGGDDNVALDRCPAEKLDRAAIFLGPLRSGQHTSESVGRKIRCSYQPLETCSASTSRNGTPSGRKPELIMARGELVPDSLVLRMVAERIERLDCSHGFVLDGFPRTVAQPCHRARCREVRDSSSRSVIHMVIICHMPLIRRPTRLTCKVGGEIYNIYDRPPKVDGACDKDGGELSFSGRTIAKK